MTKHVASLDDKARLLHHNLINRRGQYAKGTQPTGVDEKQLTKGQLRKLNALRKSLGDDIANTAFAQWLAMEGQPSGGMDRNAEVVREAVEAVVLEGKARIPRGGHFIRRGRGRVIIEQPEYE